MASNWDTKTLFDLAQRHWYKPAGLLLTIALIFIFEFGVLKFVKASGTASIVAFTITVLSTIIVWFYSKRVPKTPKGKVGFAVCIQSPNEEEYEKIKKILLQL